MKVYPTSFGLAQHAGRDSHDSFLVKAWEETVIAVLADGAGNSDTAKEAAERTVRSLVDNYETRPRSWSPQKALSEFTSRINHTLHQDSLTRFGEPELITTLSVAVIEGDRLYGLNVGDSRVYLAREGGLTRLSSDHVAPGNGFNHVLARAIGLAPEVEPHFFETELRNGDIALLCSDGIYNALDEELLADQLRNHRAARTIVSEAHEHATPETRDDLSAIVLDIQTIPDTGEHRRPCPSIFPSNCTVAKRSTALLWSNRWKSPAACGKPHVMGNASPLSSHLSKHGRAKSW